MEPEPPQSIHNLETKNDESNLIPFPNAAQSKQPTPVTRGRLDWRFDLLEPTANQNLAPKLGVPNPCTSCHKDKDNAWAVKELKGWGSVSPWRMAQPLM